MHNKYRHIMKAAAAELWAMQPHKIHAILEFLCHKAYGTPQAAAFTPQDDQAVAERKGDIMVIPLIGSIIQRSDAMMETSGCVSVATTQARFRTALNDASIKAIIFDIDSPGGTVTGVTELSQMIYEGRGIKPVIGFISGGAYSAAYWIGSACDEIVCTPSGGAGSVGVYTVHEDISAMLEAEGIKETFIFAAPYKVEGNPYEALGDEAKAFMQKQIDDIYLMFVQDVARNRGTSPEDVIENYGKGRALLAQSALQARMIDRIDTFENTLARFGVSLYASQQKQVQAHNAASRTRALKLHEMQTGGKK